jgi:hypothetical protein
MPREFEKRSTERPKAKAVINNTHFGVSKGIVRIKRR